MCDAVARRSEDAAVRADEGCGWGGGGEWGNKQARSRLGGRLRDQDVGHLEARLDGFELVDLDPGHVPLEPVQLQQQTHLRITAFTFRCQVTAFTFRSHRGHNVYVSLSQSTVLKLWDVKATGLSNRKYSAVERG